MRESDIIQRYPNGRQRVRFKTVEARKVRAVMRELIELWPRLMHERWVPSLIGLAAFNLDFLCIHPFRDGNGRVSRLLLLLQCYHLGYEVGRYISLERLIEENKERYYEALEQSSQGWHDGKHDPWPYVNFLLYMLKLAYREFEERIGQTVSPKGAKTELIIDSIRRFDGAFRVSELRQDCPGVSLDMIRRVLKDLQRARHVECLSRGQSAQWKRITHPVKAKRWK